MPSATLTLTQLRDRLTTLIEKAPLSASTLTTLTLTEEGPWPLAIHAALDHTTLDAARSVLVEGEPARWVRWAKRWGLSSEQEAEIAALPTRVERVRKLKDHCPTLSLATAVRAHDERFGR